jgi:hypothetical protein
VSNVGMIAPELLKHLFDSFAATPGLKQTGMEAWAKSDRQVGLHAGRGAHDH